ncbi:hypothetical protein [Brasilonema sp. UFV-L1]|uniref:hypothetical protein n=1 Tax=Brasilonema sp. UFV-L1 TaxID=2234130 RepID=UPI00145C80BE|nr:hypothetical protein [Brasilonema sp. UFV-L1]NMG08848.1 hypothetical protein [Brasilonema sp. UFV-L1]
MGVGVGEPKGVGEFVGFGAPVVGDFLVVPLVPDFGVFVGAGFVVAGLAVPVGVGVAVPVGLGVCASTIDGKVATGVAIATPKTREIAMDLTSLLIFTNHSS